MVNINRNFLTRAQFNNPTARTQGTGSNIASPNANNRRTQVGQLPTMKLGGTEETEAPEAEKTISRKPIQHGDKDHPYDLSDLRDLNLKKNDTVYVRLEDGSVYKYSVCGHHTIARIGIIGDGCPEDKLVLEY